jgi:peptide chain release factor 1
VTVAVLAEMEDVDVHLDMNDVRVDVYRSSGVAEPRAWVNQVAIRMTHIPTGLVVAVCGERKFHYYYKRAKQIMVARLYEMEMEKQRNAQVGTGERAEKIRTYNYPQNRVTDHRINLTNDNLQVVLRGDLDGFIEALFAWDQAERLSSGEAMTE